MKKFFIFLSLLLITGCNLPFSNKKVGVKCDEPAAVSLAEKIFNDYTKKDFKVKIDTSNIVEWDYKDGRFLCKAKIIPTTYNKKLSFFDKAIYEKYGFTFTEDKVKGWVYYQTYLTTQNMKKLKEGKDYSFYVQIEKTNDIPDF